MAAEEVSKRLVADKVAEAIAEGFLNAHGGKIFTDWDAEALAEVIASTPEYRELVEAARPFANIELAVGYGKPERVLVRPEDVIRLRKALPEVKP